ncbi:MAG: hypothetical protein LBG97_03150 [Coriobacteriales bacterium]|nr:hypothetical protein [Coriobacteriales bacterium]
MSKCWRSAMCAERAFRCELAPNEKSGASEHHEPNEKPGASEHELALA